MCKVKFSYTHIEMCVKLKKNLKKVKVKSKKKLKTEESSKRKVTNQMAISKT